MSKTSSNKALPALRKRIARIPKAPGVYRWLNDDGDILYIGKANDLRSRLKSYVAPDAGKQGAWKEALMRIVTDFEVTVVRSDLEAFVLETNLIKQYRPKYNILMKDDKNFVYVRITTKDPYPRIEVLRKMNDDGATYIGPKTSQYQVQRTLEMLRNLYPFRTCKMSIVPKDSTKSIPIDVVLKNKDRPTPCLDHHIGQCTAPCAGLITSEEYRMQCIDPVIRFLRGDQKGVAEMLKEKMKQAAVDRKFEVAAKLRDILGYMQDLAEKQTVSDTSREDADIIGVSVLSNRSQVVILRERDGKIIDDVSLELSSSTDSIGEVLSQILPQFYTSTADFPRLLVLPEPFEGIEEFHAWFAERAGRSVEIRVPERGKQSTVLKLAMKNAEERAKQREAKWESEHRMVEGALEELQKVLGLPAIPKRIEGYDISHLGGTETAGSMSVAIDGKPANRDYRHFTIHGLKSGEVDDYRSLREVLRRRLRYVVGGLKFDEAQWASKGVVFAKAKKDDQKTLEQIIQDHPKELSQTPVSYKDCIVARKGDQIAAMGRLVAHAGGLREIKSVWVSPDFRGQSLAHVIVRKLLSTLKKGKVYITLHPKHEELYADIGFRAVNTTPPVLLEQMKKDDASAPEEPKDICLMYEVQANKSDKSLEAVPDLLMIDGGKGQLGVAVEVLKEYGLSIPVIGLAKREEEIFVPGNPVSIPLPKESQGRYLLMRLRDEAHRFANRLREMKAKNTLLGG